MSEIPPTSTSRRRFLATGAAALAASQASVLPLMAEKNTLPWEVCTFTKPFQHLSYEQLAALMAEIGFDGIEAPVRPKGHIEPEAVETELPKMVEALKAQDLNLTILTSGINEVSDEQHTEKVLRTAAALGVKRYRMNYYRYDLKKPIGPQIAEFAPKFADLIALSKEIGIKPIYQNHSGNKYFGGPIWDLRGVLLDHDPADVGVAFDIGHATVEGAKAWPLNFAAIRPYIDTVYVKEPAFRDNKVEFGALGEGAVDKGFYQLLGETNFTGPISLHVEYLGTKPESEKAIIAAMKKDFATLKTLLPS